MNLEFSGHNTFCISLASHQERWEKMKQRFVVFDMSVCRWLASVGPIDTFHSELNAGQIGCAQSHISIWRHMVLHEIEYAMILEDDACFDKSWQERLATGLPEDSNWDALFLNVSEPIHPSHTWSKINGDQYLTGGYILSLRGAKKVLAMFDGYFYSSDWMTSRLQTHGHSYSYFPWIIIQEGNESTIGSGVEADHAKVVRCLREANYSLDNYVL